MPQSLDPRSTHATKECCTSLINSAFNLRLVLIMVDLTQLKGPMLLRGLKNIIYPDVRLTDIGQIFLYETEAILSQREGGESRKIVSFII